MEFSGLGVISAFLFRRIRSPRLANLGLKGLYGFIEILKGLGPLVLNESFERKVLTESFDRALSFGA